MPTRRIPYGVSLEYFSPIAQSKITSIYPRGLFWNKLKNLGGKIFSLFFEGVSLPFFLLGDKNLGCNFSTVFSFFLLLQPALEIFRQLSPAFAKPRRRICIRHFFAGFSACQILCLFFRLPAHDQENLSKCKELRNWYRSHTKPPPHASFAENKKLLPIPRKNPITLFLLCTF